MSVKTPKNLAKLSLEALEEVYEREKNILKNKNIIDKLPDKGKQLEEKVKIIEKELQLRKEMKELEDNLHTLSIKTEDAEVLKEKHVQHICNIEKSPNKERYKPFSTLVHNKELKDKTVKPTQMIPLTESMTLLAKEANKLPVSGDQIKLKIEGEVKDDENKEENEQADVESTGFV